MKRNKDIYSYSKGSAKQHHQAPPPNKKKRNKKEDDSLENTHPTDSRADEKVIVNEQVSNKIVNAPSQTGANTSEKSGSKEETAD